MLTAYKFLAKGALGPISGFAWPVPSANSSGAWLEVAGPLVLCSRGLHVCRTRDLAHWLHDELWEIEAGGEILEGLDCVVARRARLVRRVEAWSDGGSLRFVDACIEHATVLAGSAANATVRGFLEDAALAKRAGYLAVGAYSAALAVAKLGSPAASEPAYRAERAWQANWIARALIA